MIAYLEGTLLHKKPNSVIINVHGVGYQLTVPLSTFYELGEEGSSVALRVYTYVREDAISLYGFKTVREKELFEQLITVTGVGPRLGIVLLSGATVDELARAIGGGDLYRLTAVPGVGRKTAERIILELRGKMAAFAAPEEVPSSLQAVEEKAKLKEDIISALVNLGYQKGAAERAVSKTFLDKEHEFTFESALKRSLHLLAG